MMGWTIHDLFTIHRDDRPRALAGCCSVSSHVIVVRRLFTYHDDHLQPCSLVIRRDRARTSGMFGLRAKPVISVW